ncbi:histidine phosphatase family protein [Candidatus Kaiserbacteria bacterium]|nr:histidine phosphatase family protein [Candidatus Kaiserbacteria bacterium]
MKKIYLIRHGESEGNADNRWQSTEGGLTEHGREQSHALGARLAGIPFTAFVSSPMQRARETAAIIAEHTSWDTEIEYSDLFVERRKPSIQIGMERSDPSSLEIDKLVAAHFTQAGWRHSDEENYEDMTARARKALLLLTEHPRDEIVVVMHGYFMRVMLAVAICGESLTPQLCEHFLSSLRTANAGISLLIYDETVSRPWWLWTWNDHAHVMGR